MKRKLLFSSLIALILLLIPITAWPQTSAVPWSAFSGGFGVVSSANTTVQASTGEIAGAAEGGNTSVKSGFLVVKLQPGSVTAIDVAESLPTTYALRQNYPNPFNPSTTLRFDLPAATDIHIVVYDLLGREVVRLVDQRLEAGYHQLVWNGRDRSGREVPTGMYIVQMLVPSTIPQHAGPTAGTTPEYRKSIKLVMLK